MGINDSQNRNENWRNPIRLLVVGSGHPWIESLRGDLEPLISRQSVTAETDGEALSLVMSRSFDIVLIKGWVEDVCVTEICKNMREMKVSCPLVVWSKRWSEADEISILRAGANDYVTVEMANDVMVARIIAHVRQFRASGRATYEIGGFLFCPTTHTLVDVERWDCLKLTNKQAGLLKYLCLADGSTVSYKELMTNVWYSEPNLESHTINTHICRLRRVIADNFRTDDIIVTDGKRYRIGDGKKSPAKAERC